MTRLAAGVTSALRRLVASEPVALVAGAVALLGLAGVEVATDDQAAAVRVLAVVLPLVGAVVARQAVTPTGRAVEGEQQAIADTLSALADGTLDPYVHSPASGHPAPVVILRDGPLDIDLTASPIWGGVGPERNSSPGTTDALPCPFCGEQAEAHIGPYCPMPRGASRPPAAPHSADDMFETLGGIPERTDGES